MRNRKLWSRLAIALAVVVAMASAVVSPSALGAQDDDTVWSPAPPTATEADEGKTSYIQPEAFSSVTLNQDALEALLSAGGGANGTTLITVPDPDGVEREFEVSEVPIYEPELASEFPNHKAYAGVATDKSLATIRFEVTPFGFHAQVADPAGWWYVDPFFHLDTSLYISYNKADLPKTVDFVEDLEGQLAIEEGAAEMADDAGGGQRSGTQTRTHRLAIATNDKYSTFHGGTVPSVLAAITTSVNRVNGIYGPELAIQLQLVANTTDLIYLTDAANGGGACPTPGTAAGPFCDPYPDGDALGLNQTNIDNVIGFANYDIGHHYTTGCGLAGLAVVGTNRKAEGCTGINPPTNDPFYVDYVAHEMGHQYGGSHTFNGARNSCAGGNRSASSAYEPGSATTIQGYAGICGLDNVQLAGTGATGASDPYFHSRSFDQMIAHTTGGSPGDLGAVASGNNVPTAAAGADASIPASTPFHLTGAGTDADGAGTLTYNWEQRDLGEQRALDNPQITAGPLFRSQPPTASPTRYFPRLSTVAANNTNVPGPCPALTGTIGAAQACWSEFLPTAARSLNFRVVVRDNNATSGGVNTDDIALNVVDTGAPFRVTSPNAGGVLVGAAQTITWDVSGTNAAPINAATVNIRLSTDGGLTFPTLLATNTPNDGSQLVNFPGIPVSTTARIMVEQGGTPGGTGVRFFDMSDVNFTTPMGGGCIPVVPNDDLANAAVLMGANATATISNNCATAEVGELTHDDSGGNAPSRSIWWQWTAPANGPVTVDTEGTVLAPNNDTVLGVYTGNAVNALTIIGQDDDGGTGLLSKVDFVATAGTTYKIAADAWAATNIGPVTININQGGGAGTCNGLAATLVVPPGGANFFGTAGNDVIVGTGGVDNVFGLGGDDTICGFGGDDNLNGGNGNDWISGGDDNDFVAGQGQVDTVMGDAGNDQVIGGIGNDILSGGPGMDLMRGQGNNDTINGDGDVDVIFGGSGNDIINTGTGGNRGVDCSAVWGMFPEIAVGTCPVTGNGNNDTITGSPTNDDLDGQNGLDIVNGGGGDDLLRGGLGADTLNGDAGNDTLQGAGSADTLNGGADNDSMSGGGGAPDRCNGDGGVDTLADATCEIVTGVP